MERELYGKILKDLINMCDGITDDNWQDIVDKYELGIHKDSLRKAFATTQFSAYNVYKYMQESNCDENIREEIKKLEKLKIQYQDQKREYRNYLRIDARLDHVKQEIVKAIKETDDFYTSKYSGSNDGKNICASLILSDWHAGLMIDDMLNRFNNNIMIDRVCRLRDKVIDYCRLNNVYQLNIEILGDMCQGYLHIGSKVFNEEDVISQTMRVSNVLARLIDELAKHVPEIKVYSCIGNHGRCSANIKESLQVENFERLITWHLQTKLQNPNVKVYDCETDMITYKNMNGNTIVAVHGNLDKPNQIVNNFIKMYKFVPEEFHLGHTHFYQENDEYDINVVVNGTLSGMDQFAKSIRKTSLPCQILRVYGDDVCTYKIKL